MLKSLLPFSPKATYSVVYLSLMTNPWSKWWWDHLRWIFFLICLSWTATNSFCSSNFTSIQYQILTDKEPKSQKNLKSGSSPYTLHCISMISIKWYQLWSIFYPCFDFQTNYLEFVLAFLFLILFKLLHKLHNCTNVFKPLVD